MIGETVATIDLMFRKRGDVCESENHRRIKLIEHLMTMLQRVMDERLK